MLLRGGHTLPARVVTGLIKVYDVHDYLAEKRAALASWEAHLAAVIAGGNVVPMARAASA